MIRSLSFPTFCMLGVLAATSSGSACPLPEKIAAALSEFDLRGTVGAEVPSELFDQAAREPGRPAVARRGKHGFGVLVAALPVERLWMGIADEEHHALELPVLHSEVIGGTPRGTTRTLFQYVKRWGVGRWWATEVTVDAGIFDSSGGRLWQLRWRDVMDTVDRSRPPVSTVAAEIEPIRATRGGWLLIPLGESCTVVAYSNLSEPGGAVGATQWIFVPRTLRATLLGVTRLAGEHLEQPHDGPAFLRPDGTPIPLPRAGRPQP
jgi:hypothetical protein